MSSSTTRFSQTVENYQKFRPGYPVEIIDFMVQNLSLNAEVIITDIGSGTGKLTQLFLENGNKVYGVEPNFEMRLAAEKQFESYSNFHSINGTAEATNIESQSVHFITAAQAFHWFDVPKTKLEFQRILKKDGLVLLIWNKRLDSKSDFMLAYNHFLDSYSTDLQNINLRRVANEDGMNKFFGEGNFQLEKFEHFQDFDFEGVLGRYLSCSYAYQNDHLKYSEMYDALKRLFNEHQENGQIKMWYKTVVYFGKL